MNYVSVAEMAKKWNLSERSVRNYCAQNRIPGAYITGKTWCIPETAVKPQRSNAHAEKPETLLEILRNEKQSRSKGGIYHKVQIDLTYNSNHMEGSRLTHDQTRYIYETNTISTGTGGANVDDILETANHFRCIDFMIEHAHLQMSEKLIRQMHRILKSGTSDSRRDWFTVGGYKKIPNEVGGNETAALEEVPLKMRALLTEYNAQKDKTFDEILEFHYQFERIHPFQDGNGRIGRLVMFQECLRNGIVPFIIEDDLKMFYYRGLSEWKQERGYLCDTCLTAQDRFRAYLDYFRIKY